MCCIIHEVLRKNKGRVNQEPCLWVHSAAATSEGQYEMQDRATLNFVVCRSLVIIPTNKNTQEDEAATTLNVYSQCTWLCAALLHHTLSTSQPLTPSFIRPHTTTSEWSRQAQLAMHRLLHYRVLYDYRCKFNALVYCICNESWVHK